MSTNSTDANITLHSPEELLREIPALLGFVPDQSLVAVLLDRAAVRCTLRWNLEEDLIQIAIRSIGIAHRAEADGAILAVYGDGTAADSTFVASLNRAADLLEEQGIQVHDLLWVSDDRWGSFMCSVEGCCPSEGRPVPTATSHLEVVRVAAGRPAVAANRRAILAALKVSPEPEDSPAFLKAKRVLQELSRRDIAELAVRTLTRSCAAESSITDDHARAVACHAVLVLAVQDVAVRDFVLGSVAASDLEPACAGEVLTRAALRAPERLRGSIAATAMAVLALDGQNSVALWRMAELAHGESLAQLIGSAVEAGLPPHEVRDLFASTLSDVRGQLEGLDVAR